MDSFKFKKKYGQNFLIDKNIVKKIINTLTIKEDNLVIEIGCGDGKLTKELCENFNQVIGYEIDKDLERILNKNLSKYNNKEIIYDDFLKRSIKEDLKKYSFTNLYIVANLPYYITTPIIQKIIEENLNVETMRFMVQKEVGERFAAKVGTKSYGSITVYLNYKFELKKDFIVKKSSFKPQPDVDSMIISFYKKNMQKVKNEKILYRLIRDSFKYKRKKLKNNLKGYDFTKIKEILEKYNYTENTRAEQIPIEVFCEIANSITEKTNS